MPDQPAALPDPDTVEPVSLSDVAFVGYTERAGEPGASVVNRPVRVSSPAEFEKTFGGLSASTFAVVIERTAVHSGAAGAGRISLAADEPVLPDRLLPHSVRLFMENGGQSCIVVSTGTFSEPVDPHALRAGIDALDNVEQPLLIAVPDICRVSLEGRGPLVDHALAHCAKRRDRFVLIDVPDAMTQASADIAHIRDDFRDRITSDWVHLRYGAAYYPHLRTRLRHEIDADRVTIAIRTPHSAARSGDGPRQAPRRLSELADNGDDARLREAVTDFLSTEPVTLPPSGAVAGVYVRNDALRGVWKAPANVPLQAVDAPAIAVDDPLNDALTSDPVAGKSVNAIRALPGKGTVIWGARTLAGNDAEYRYVPVRRLLMLVELSLERALAALTTQPNEPATWSRAARIAAGFLHELWQSGALQGANPEDAFFVHVGMGRTMNARDIQEGRLIVHVGLAPLKPAEFVGLPIVLYMSSADH